MIKRFIRILEYIGGKKVYGIIVAVIIIMFLITSIINNLNLSEKSSTVETKVRESSIVIEYQENGED